MPSGFYFRAQCTLHPVESLPGKDEMNELTHNGCVMTVTGPIESEGMGVTLPHEHLMSTFGAEPVRYPHYDTRALFEAVSPYLTRLKSLGCQTIVDCTAAYFGRHPEILRRLSENSGIYVLTNTGYYGAGDDRYIPPHAYEETADQIAARWIWEWEKGIDGTGVYPGFIKTAVDDGPLSDIDRKLLIAAARSHRQTGLTIQTHTGDNPSVALEILSILANEQVDPNAWIWVHAHHLHRGETAIQAAESGAWISFDGVNAETAPHILSLIREMKAAGMLDHVLLSHDGDSYCTGAFRPYHYLFTNFLPSMQENNFLEGEITKLTIDNPRQAFEIRVRS